MITVFAFGSNMNPAQMRQRCPSAKFAGTAELPGHRLVFVGHSHGWGGAVATIEPCEGRSVPGVLWEISDADLVRLDGFEGAPRVYERRKARLAGRKGSIVLYVHARPVRGVPSAAYVAAIRTGYRFAGYGEKHLDAAVRRAQRERDRRARNATTPISAAA